jgi:hypothetical protein
VIRSNLSIRKTAQGSATATTRRSGFATAAGFAARRSAAATVTVEQLAQAAQDAAATGLAARIAAARLATTARLTTAAGLSGATTARLGSAAGLSGTTTARFAATSFFAATRLAAIMLVEQVEQAAAVTAAAVVATATTMTEESRSAIGARQHRGNAQDQRHQTKTNVHRGHSYTNSNGEGNTRLRHTAVRTAELPPATRGKCRRLVAQRRIAALAGAPTLESSSPAIVYAVRKALPTRRFCHAFARSHAQSTDHAASNAAEPSPIPTILTAISPNGPDGLVASATSVSVQPPTTSCKLARNTRRYPAHSSTPIPAKSLKNPRKLLRFRESVDGTKFALP